MLDWPLFAHRRAGFHLLLLQALLLLGQLRIWAGMADGAYLKSRCGFQSQNYTIKWAYEPQTQNVVFVLKAKLPIGQQAAGDKEEATEKRLLTGIAFGSETEMDFVGIAFSAINDQLDLVSGRANAGDSLRLSTVPRDGQQQPKGNNNSLTGPAMATVRGISLKRRPQDGSVIAEFARPLSGERPAARADLSGCTTFFLLTQWMAFDPTTKEKSELPISTAIRRQVCALTEKCSLDVREIHGQPPTAGEDKPAEAVQQQRHRDELVHGGTEDVAQSVDVSGKGDPCSFVGADYAVQWSYNKAKDAVEFVMRLRAKKGRWWSAVGIGDNMSDMDIGVVFMENGQPKEMVDYFSSSYDVPDRDSSQDWKLDKAESRGGVEGEEVELHFWRRLITDDAEKDRSLDGCVLFQFAANGGNYGPGNRIHKHHDWPDLYKACDLKKRCIRQKRQSSKEEDGNLPEISHSTDNKEAESNSKAGGKEAPGSGDKVISLLMKSLGPQIVQTVSESKADANYRNASAETGTVFPILGDDSTANYTAGPTSVNGKQDVENPNPVLALKPPANKRQEPLGGETTALPTETTTSALPAEEQTYSTAVATPPTAVSSNTGSPFSLNAFLGGNGGGEPPPAPVGEPAVTASSTPTTASSSTAVLRISGEATSAEAGGGGGGGASTQQGGGGDDAGFGINQLFGEGSSTAAANGADEGVEQGRTVSTGNDTSATLGTQATTAAASGQIGGQLGSLPPVGEPAPAQAPGGEVGGGHPAEEAEAAANTTTVAAIPPSTAAATEQGTAITEPYEEQSSQQQPAATTPLQQQPSAAEQTTYAVPERPSSAASSTVSSSPTASAGPTTSTGGFELIASPTQNGGETTGTETDEPTSSRRPPEEASTPTPTTLATTIASSSSSSSASSPIAPPATAAGTSASTKAESEEELQGRGEDEDLIYSTPAPQSPPPPSPAPQPRASSQNPNTVLEESSSTGAGAMELEEPAAGNGTTAGGGGQTSGPERGQPQVPAGHGGASSSASGELEERGIKLPVATSKCDALRPDLPICQSYMGAYMERVKDWAERHGQPVENQFPKACKLLSAVPHVPTLCCQHFADKCADYV